MNPDQQFKQKKFKWWLWGPIGLFVLFLVFGFFVSSTPDGKARAREKLAIEYCWETQGKKSLDPSAARFAAGACEMMEEDFRRRWGFKP